MKVLVLLFVLHLVYGDPSICEKCKCDNQSVKCDKVSNNDIFANSTWTTPILKFSVHNSNLMTLVDQFPASNLKELDLSRNDIRVIGDGIFQNLQNMTHLDLSHNAINDLRPDVFKGVYHENRYMNLASLRVLRLDHNELLSIDPDLFEHIEDLAVLDISFNPLKVVDQHASVAFSSLQKLKSLDLSGTKITGLPNAFLHTHRNLETLDLSENPIQTIPSTFEFADNLLNLYLNKTAFVALNEDNRFPEMKNLKVLHMCHIDSLTNISKHALSGLRNLEALYLCNNQQLSNIDAMALGERDGGEGAVIYPNIRELYIQNNQLVSISSQVIASWVRLIHLDIRGNPWACECHTEWLITILMPIYARITSVETAKEVQCGSPIEMEHQKLYELYQKNYQVRCLDLYGAHPENDAMMLVGVLAGVLIALPVILFILYAYQRKWFGFCSSSPAAYSRQFYNRSTSINDDNDF